MKFGRLFVTICGMVLLTAHAVQAGEPTDKVRETSDKIIAIISDEGLKAPEKDAERRAKARAEVDKRFDWTEMARRSLSRYWAQRTPQEQKEFTKLFSDLLERAYMDKVEGYKGQAISYLGETIDGEYAAVKVSIAKDSSGATIPVEYRLRHKNNDWLVYDVIIEGVSLVNNYRTQFTEILRSSTYTRLVERIQAKLRENHAG